MEVSHARSETAADVPQIAANGNPGKKRLNKNEPQPPIPPEPPAFLSGYARDEWRRLAGHLHAFGMLTVLDYSIFAVYCGSVGRWMRAEEALATMAVRDPETGALTIRSPTGCVTVHPLLRIAIGAARDVVRHGAEFGLSPAARSRVSGGIVAQIAPSKFAGLLAE